MHLWHYLFDRQPNERGGGIATNVSHQLHEGRVVSIGVKTTSYMGWDILGEKQNIIREFMLYLK